MGRADVSRLVFGGLPSAPGSPCAAETSAVCIRPTVTGLDPALVAEMEDHLAACPDCTAYDRAVSHGVNMLRGARLDPSPEFRDRLNARIASGEAVPEPIPPRVSPWAATAAALVLATLVVSPFGSPPTCPLCLPPKNRRCSPVPK